MIRWLAVGLFVINLASEQGYAAPLQSGSRAPAESKKIRCSRETGAQNADAAAANTQNILWEDPVDIEGRDLLYGPGGKQGAPDPSAKFTFIQKLHSGTQKKIIVKDDRGRKWTVKFGPEARPETSASRILWAAGYHVDQDYFVKRARIEGYRVSEIRDVRFERRNDGLKSVGKWSWKKNPFVGSRELDGLKVLMALLRNWDLKTDNNKIKIATISKHQKRSESISGRVYYVADLGSTLGSTGTFFNKLPFFKNLPPDRAFWLERKKAKGDAEAFEQGGFIKKTGKGVVEFNCKREEGRHVMKHVSIQDARWMGDLLGKLSDRQLADAFHAGGFNEVETAIYVRTMRERIRQLQKLTISTP